jgi:hypothetical protein
MMMLQVQLLLGTLPSQVLMEQYGLQQYGPLVQVGCGATRDTKATSFEPKALVHLFQSYPAIGGGALVPLLMQQSAGCRVKLLQATHALVLSCSVPPPPDLTPPNRGVRMPTPPLNQWTN